MNHTYVAPYAKNPANQLRGAQNRAQGDIFEQIINASCVYYRENGFAEIDKTPEPMKPIQNMGQGKFLAYFETQAQPDYKGTLHGGQAIDFEAKHTEGNRIKQDRVTKEQSEALDRHQGMGAACFVLVSIQMRLFALVPWKIWKNMKLHYGHKYMSEDDLKPYSVPFNGRTVSFLKGLSWEDHHA